MITSLVARIEHGLGALKDAQIEFLPNDWSHLITQKHFIQGHLLWATTNNDLGMTYIGYNFELLLLAPEFKLNRVHQLNHAAPTGTHKAQH